MKYSFQISKVLPLAVVLATFSIASAGPVIFQRALPTTNLNNAAGVNRSNAGPIQGSFSGVPFTIGDDFILPGSGNYVIDTLSVFMITNTLAGTPSSEFSKITLYGGKDNLPALTQLTQLSQTYSATKVQYNGTTDFQSVGGSSFFSIYQITFSGLAWAVQGSQYYDFAVNGTPIGSNTFALHVSNDVLGGATNAGPLAWDGSFLIAQGSPLAITAASNSTTIPGFNKGSDVNVIITSGVPEPSSFGMLAIGIGALVMRLRRK